MIINKQLCVLLYDGKGFHFHFSANLSHKNNHVVVPKQTKAKLFSAILVSQWSHSNGHMTYSCSSWRTDLSA